MRMNRHIHVWKTSRRANAACACRFALLLLLTVAPTIAGLETGAAQAVPPAPRMPPAVFPENGPWGLVVHSQHTQAHAELFKSIGVQWVRLGVGWHELETTARGTYDLDSTDAMLRPYLDQGLRVLLLVELDKVSPFYRDALKNKDVDALVEGFAGLYGALAERFKGQGIVWELGNEPECFHEGIWNNPENYTKLARACAGKIRAADPGAKIAAISAAWMDRNFIERSFSAGLLDDNTIDVIAFHGYHRATNLPESNLAEDVKWLRSTIRRNFSRRPIGIIDSERGYYIRDYGEPRSWDNWRQYTSCETEQAAYLARHYLEEIFLGVEISVWYKDMRGEQNCSLFYDEKSPRLRPMGHVYRNLARLLPENPTRMRNDRYGVTLVDLDDKIGAPDSSTMLRTYLRSYLRKDAAAAGRGQQLIIAMWNPVEAFDGKILQERKRVGDNYVETWRPIAADDLVEVPVKVQVNGLKGVAVKSVARYDLLAQTAEAAAAPIEHSPQGDGIVTTVLNVGPMPLVVVIDLEESARQAAVD